MKVEEFKALPNGTRVVWNGFRAIAPITGTFTRDGDFYKVAWDNNGHVIGSFSTLQSHEGWVQQVDVVNFATIKVEIPAGWVATGEFRSPSPLVDCYLHQDGVTVIEAKCGNQPCLGPRVILKRIVPKTLADRIRDYTSVIGEAIDATNPADEGALRIVILREVRRDLIEILKEFDGPESKA